MATSKLQKAVGNLLDKAFPEFSIKENCRPDWLLSSNLTRLELDFYIDELKIAFEIQGRQHYEFTPHFHKDYTEFELGKQYDAEKKDLCYGAGITLIEIDTLMDAIIEVKTLKEAHGIIQKPIKKKPKKRPRYDPVRRYQINEFRLINKGDPVAKDEQKLKEIKQCHRKFRKFFNKPVGERKYRIPVFEFKYLNYDEQSAILEEYGIQSMVIDELSITSTPSCFHRQSV